MQFADLVRCGRRNTPCPCLQNKKTQFWDMDQDTVSTDLKVSSDLKNKESDGAK